MEITQIKYFLEAANTQHITKSAEKLHIAQPALSQAIKRFEEDLKVPLFIKNGRNIVLTRYGKFLKEKLEPIVKELDELPSIVQTMANLDCDTIHLNVLAASALVTNAIIDYQSENNDELNFQLLQNHRDEIYDIEITTKLFYQTPQNDSKNRFVCVEKIFLAVPNNKKYENKKSISLKEVENEGFISLMGSKQFRYICDKFCSHIGISPKIIFESDNPAAVKNMIGANLGVGFWPEFTWGRLDNHKVRLLEIEDMPCSRDILITYSKNKKDNKNVESFFEYLKNYCINEKRNALMS